MSQWSADGFNGWSADGYNGWSADGFQPAIIPPPIPPIPPPVTNSSFEEANILSPTINMRYRPLGPGGDYTIDIPFLFNSPQCVAQAVYTRLLLYLGEWFLDTADGTPWFQNIVGPRAGRNPDIYIKQRILATPNVTSIVSYQSSFNGVNRTYTVTTTINTLYGKTTVTASVQVPS